MKSPIDPLKLLAWACGVATGALFGVVICHVLHEEELHQIQFDALKRGYASLGLEEGRTSTVFTWREP